MWSNVVMTGGMCEGRVMKPCVVHAVQVRLQVQKTKQFKGTLTLAVHGPCCLTLPGLIAPTHGSHTLCVSHGPNLGPNLGEPATGAACILPESPTPAPNPTPINHVYRNLLQEPMWCGPLTLTLPGPLECVQHIWAQEGLRGLWRCPLTSAPAQATPSLSPPGPAPLPAPLPAPAGSAGPPLMSCAWQGMERAVGEGCALLHHILRVND